MILQNYIIPSDNWEQQLFYVEANSCLNYIIPSDNWEQQLSEKADLISSIISYQAITGNNNAYSAVKNLIGIISYQAITGNNN